LLRLLPVSSCIEPSFQLYFTHTSRVNVILSNLEAGTPVDGLITSKPYMKACVGAALSLLHQKEKRPMYADKGLYPCEPLAQDFCWVDANSWKDLDISQPQ